MTTAEIQHYLLALLQAMQAQGTIDHYDLTTQRYQLGNGNLSPWHITIQIICPPDTTHAESPK